MDSAWIIVPIVAAILGASLLIYALMSAISQAVEVDAGPVPSEPDTARPAPQAFADFWDGVPYDPPEHAQSPSDGMSDAEYAVWRNINNDFVNGKG